ncbi:MAG: nucleotidyltransferase family protein [Bacillati bacterium ANGP1]|uniref:Nucleotidyltransferase family protein n=1 Tax=Candidatus Segetimicrobium genomatis TaxID=2569760 RepID=A0A537K660_9BACT|nr:MAG: nucleotidyltransferase family protein [Terrabacteria group bacterium ANGP1]
MIAAVILAAGQSRRMGRPKLLLPLAGRSVVRRVVENARGSACGEIVVVVGEAEDRIAAEVRGPLVRLVVNGRSREGMGTSLAAGIAALPAGCEAAVVLLGDQPCVDAGAINALIDAHRRTGKPIIASRYGAVTGAPTLLGRALFDEARDLTGDVGGRFLIERHPDLVAEVSLPPLAAADLDTPDDFARLKERVEGDPPRTGGG